MLKIFKFEKQKVMYLGVQNEPKLHRYSLYVYMYLDLYMYILCMGSAEYR
jgi:hypothetical protein